MHMKNNNIKINYVIESYNPLNPPKPILNEDGYYYYIYQITNLINGKIYVGKHKTKNLNDRYFGSGSKLKEDYKIFNKEKDFRKDILAYLTSEDEMDTLEESLVSLEFCNRTDTYNVVPGGKGGQYYVTSMGGIACKKRYENDPKFKEEVNKKRSETLKRTFSDPINKERIHKILLEHGKKYKEQFFHYIHNDTLLKSIRVAEKDLNIYIENGWKIGRKIYNKQYMFNKQLHKYKWVLNEDVNKYILDGWIIIPTKPNNKQRKRIDKINILKKDNCFNYNSANKNKYNIKGTTVHVYNIDKKISLLVLKSELDLFLKQGFVKGRGLIYIHNNTLNKCKQIFKHELQEYLDNGWELGGTLYK